MRITHVITDMRIGGASIMLQRLATELQAKGVNNTIIALGGVSDHFDGLRRLGIPLDSVGMTPNLLGVGAFLRLRRRIAASRPDVVHTWTYHANLLGGLAARTSVAAPVVWGLHHAPGKTERFKPLTRTVMRASALLSAAIPSRIVCCAEASKAVHVALGYPPRSMVVITNGFDTDAFRPDPDARASVRRELGLPCDTPLVGLMARFHPQKDHRTFVRAATLLSARLPAVHFILAGRGVNARNPELDAWLAESGEAGRFHLLGPRHDMPRLMAACDLVCSASAFGEAFPLVLGEAMSCGTPCVTTDVGDSPALVGETGRVVAPCDAEGMANAWASILTLTPDEWRRLGALARARVAGRHQLATCAQAHLALYEELRRTGAGT